MKKVEIGRSKYATYYTYKREWFDEILHPDWLKVGLFLAVVLWLIYAMAVFIQVWYLLGKI